MSSTSPGSKLPSSDLDLLVVNKLFCELSACETSPHDPQVADLESQKSGSLAVPDSGVIHVFIFEKIILHEMFTFNISGKQTITIVLEDGEVPAVTQARTVANNFTATVNNKLDETTYCALAHGKNFVMSKIASGAEAATLIDLVPGAEDLPAKVVIGTGYQGLAAFEWDGSPGQKVTVTVGASGAIELTPAPASAPTGDP